MNWITLNKSEQLRGIIDASHNKPQVIFKHSTTCPISSMAKARLDNDNGQLEDVDVYYLDLLSYRTISNFIAEELGVHHESPQVIVLHHGQVTHDESHLDISVQDILQHFKFIEH